MTERNNHDHAAAGRRSTVCVTCAVPNGLQIMLHQIHDADVDHNSRVMLKPGDNPEIDREWFGCWLQENHELSLVTSGQITWRDDQPKDAAPAEDRGPVFAQPQSQPDSIEEMRQPGDAPFADANQAVEDDKTAN